MEARRSRTPTPRTTGLRKGALWSHEAVVSVQLHTWIEAVGRRDEIDWTASRRQESPILLATWKWRRCDDRASRSLHTESVLETIETEHVTSTLLIRTMIGDLSNDPTFSEIDLSSMRLIIDGSVPTTISRQTLIEAFAASCSSGTERPRASGVGSRSSVTKITRGHPRQTARSCSRAGRR